MKMAEKMKKIKNLCIGLLIFSLTIISFNINNSFNTKVSSNDKNCLPLTQLENTSTNVKKFIVKIIRMKCISKLKNIKS